MTNNGQITLFQLFLYCCDHMKSHRSGDTVPLRQCKIFGQYSSDACKHWLQE